MLRKTLKTCKVKPLPVIRKRKRDNVGKVAGRDLLPFNPLAKYFRESFQVRIKINCTFVQ
jgi:hypothetical protein